jgi:EKC/KEOPS complex subunit CGI121/TPRKB
LHLALFTEVTNAQAMMDLVKAHDFPGALIDPRLVVGTLQLQVAAIKALDADAKDSLASQTVHSELVYNLSPERKMSQAFSTFGMSPDATTVLVAMFDVGVAEFEEAAAGKVVGTRVPFVAGIGAVTDEAQVKKKYKIRDVELEVSSLEEATVHRIATRDV